MENEITELEQWIDERLDIWTDNRQAQAMLAQAKATLLLTKQMQRVADVLMENNGEGGILVAVNTE